MYPIERNPFWIETRNLLRTIATTPSLIQQDVVDDALKFFEHPNSNPADILHNWHIAQRAIVLHLTGLSNDAAALEHLNKTTDVLWHNAPSLPAPESAQRKLGAQLVDAPARCESPKVLLRVSVECAKIANEMVRIYLEKGIPFNLMFSDYEFMTRIMERASVEQLKAISDYWAAAMTQEKMDKVIAAVARPPKELAARQDPAKAKALSAWRKDYSRRAEEEEYFYTLTIVPSPADAEIDGIPYDRYVKTFFEMTDQPWPQIEREQALAIEELNAANEIHITNDDGTDIRFNITGHTFANSVTSKNNPGSEMFSCPTIDGVNGVIHAKGKFMHDGKYMEDLFFRFVNGEVVEFDAKVGKDHLTKILEQSGAKRVGEIAFGTNTWLQKHVVNDLLVEKIGGTFHFALGHPYKYTSYNGKPVNLSNGNVSDEHWDIAVMLKGKNGKVYLDGRLWQDNGRFVDGVRYAVLNDGWAAVPVSERPEIWTQLLAQRGRERAA